MEPRPTRQIWMLHGFSHWTHYFRYPTMTELRFMMKVVNGLDIYIQTNPRINKYLVHKYIQIYNLSSSHINCMQGIAKYIGFNGLYETSLYITHATSSRMCNQNIEQVPNTNSKCLSSIDSYTALSLYPVADITMPSFDVLDGSIFKSGYHPIL